MFNSKILDAISGTGAAAPAGAAPAPAAPRGAGFGMPANSIRALLEKNYDAIMNPKQTFQPTPVSSGGSSLPAAPAIAPESGPQLGMPQQQGAAPMSFTQGAGKIADAYWDAERRKRQREQWEAQRNSLPPGFAPGAPGTGMGSNWDE